MRSCFILFFILNISNSLAQSKKIDSLNAVISSNKHDTIIGSALNDLTKFYINLGDTANYYLSIDKFGKLFEKSKNQKLGSSYYLLQATFEENIHGDKVKTLELFQRSYDCSIKANDKTTAGRRLSKIGKLFMDLGKFKEAIDILYKSIKLNEEIGNLVGVSYSYFGLGEVFRLQKNPKKALESYYRGYALAQQTQDKFALSASYNNIGMIYNMNEQTDSALFYFNKAVDFNTKNNNEPGVASALERISTIYMRKNQHQKAIELLERVLKIKQKYGDKQQMAVTYINLAEAFLGLKKHAAASKNLELAIDISRQLNLVEFLEYCYKLEGIIYKAEGKYEKSAESLFKYIQLHDSLITMQTSRLASEQEGKFQSERKKKEIELLNKDKVIQEADLKKQKQFSYFVVLVAILLGLTVFVIFRGLKQKQKDNKALSEKNEIINKQKIVVEEKNKEITDSINYAKRIQYALLASDNFLKKYLAKHFVFFKPKDIVSGDFYWATTHNEKFYLAVCDSTGHGVPGAFMSLLNIGFLSEAINEKEITEPNLIFDHVRRRLVETISAEGQKDGFDGILICLDTNTKQISYAAANNAPVIVSNGVVIDGESNKMPVGYGEKNDPFDLYIAKGKPGDMLYLFTDGYQDQFGGPKGKKFMSKKLNELLVSVSREVPDQQRTILKTNLQEWKGELEQVDDVCVIGIKL